MSDSDNTNDANSNEQQRTVTQSDPTQQNRSDPTQHNQHQQQQDVKDDTSMTEKATLTKFVYGRNQSTLGQRFEDWLELFDLALGINGIKEEHHKAYFLLNIGEELLDIYRSKKKSDSTDTYKEVREMLTAHLKPETVHRGHGLQTGYERARRIDKRIRR